MPENTDAWTPSVRCDLDDGAIAFTRAVTRFREWAAQQPLKPLTLSTGWHVITPQMAEELLKRNRHNRTLRYNDVLRYAQQMINGRWKKTGEPIIITDQGEVEDAGHRLTACYLSGASFETFVVADVPHDDQLFAYIDNGVSRTGEDTLHCAGMNGMSKHIAAVIRDYAIRYDEGTLVYRGRLRTSPITNVDILDYAQAHPDLADTAKLVKDLYPAAIKRLSDPKVATFVAWKIRDTLGEGVLEDFYTDLVRTDLPANSPIAALQKRLDEHEAALLVAPTSPRAAKRLTPLMILALTIRAFNLARAGVSVRDRRIDPRQDDAFPRFDEEQAEAA